MSNKYRPSNGTEGEIFMKCFCSRCSREEGCTIWLDTMTYDTDDPEYPPEWIYQGKEPVCTAYQVAAEEISQEPTPPPQKPERPKVPGEQMEMWHR